MKWSHIFLFVLAVAASTGRYVLHPFPAGSENPVVALMALDAPMLLWLMHGWYAAMSGTVVFIGGTLVSGVWRVWLEPAPRKPGGRGGLPPWPISETDEKPAIVVGETHHPVEAREVPNSVVAWIGAEMEFALSQAVASGDTFEHRPSECGHCVQNFLAGLDFRDLPGEAAGFELGADDTLPTADLRFYPAALVVPCGHLPGHAAIAADLGNMAIPNGWIPRRLRSGHCVLWRRYNHIQGLPIPFPQQIPCGRSIIGTVSQKARDRGIELIQEPG